MRSRTVIISLLAGGAIMLPLLASGHGMELMQARLQFDPAGIAHLEMTADYAGNPMINSEGEARTALQDLLRIEVGGQQHKLSELAPLRLEKRDQFDPTSPLPLPEEAAGVKHQLLTPSGNGGPPVINCVSPYPRAAFTMCCSGSRKPDPSPSGAC